MSTFVSLAIAFTIMLIQLFLQTSPAVFMLFYHNVLASFSFKKADDLALGFILGVQFFATILIVIFYLIFSFLFIDNVEFLTTLFPFLLALCCFALAFFSLCFYFQRGRGRAQLFFSKNTAEGLLLASRKAKTRSDAIMLGISTAATEVIFTLPLYIILIVSSLDFSASERCSIMIADVIISVAPLFALRIGFKSRHNLAEFERLRVKNRLKTRICLSSLYLLLTFLLIYVGVVANGQ